MVVLAPFIPYAVAGAQAGLGFLNMNAQNTEQRKQRNAAQLQLRIKTQQENERRRQSNILQDIKFKVAEQLRDQQLAFNAEAAQAGYAAEQNRLNEVYTKSGFATFAQQAQLMKAMGTNAAAQEGNRGRSFDRQGLLATLGAYGQMQAEKVAQLTSERRQSDFNMQNIHRQHTAADMRARASTMIPPTPLGMLPPPASLPFANPSTNLLNAGSLLIGAAQTGFGLTAPGDKFFGITRRA